MGEKESYMEKKLPFSNKWVLLIVITIVGFLADWYTKYLAETMLRMGKPVEVIGDYLQFILVYNKGMLFGFDPRSIFPGFPLHLFFFIFSTIAVIVLLIYYHHIRVNDLPMRFGLALILPGAIGNLWDRIIHPQKGVVDFIKMGISEDVYWPIYNFADIYVSVGVGILLFCFIRDEVQSKKEPESFVEEKGKERGMIMDENNRQQ
ncbi:MAG: signal peptidase II [Chitinivibrionales bacterium]|nr:signal peptidase II [Chitinivibrionales bacterium]